MLRCLRIATTTPPAFTFYVGLHLVHYLDLIPPHVTIMTSRQHVNRRHVRHWPSAHPDRPLVLDSGGFWEVTRYGTHRTPSNQYAALARFVQSAHPGLRWVAVQDWMCETPALQRTGLTVADHQTLTIRSYLDLASQAPDVPWAPVLQGQTADEYLRHAEQHHRAGIPILDGTPVGIGSVCRRQGTIEVSAIVSRLHAEGVTGLHAFGAKTSGIRRYGHLIASSDSTAWLEDSIHRGHAPACTIPTRPTTAHGQPHRTVPPTYPPGHCPGCITAFYDRTVASLLARPAQI